MHHCCEEGKRIRIWYKSQGHVGNLSRNTKGIVGAQYGHVSSSSWGTVGAQLGQKAQYGHSMARFSKGTVWAQSGHSWGTNE